MSKLNEALLLEAADPEMRKLLERSENTMNEIDDNSVHSDMLLDILERDKTSLDLFWIKDKSLADMDSLSEPDVLAADIIENLQSTLESFQEMQAQLGK